MKRRTLIKFLSAAPAVVAVPYLAPKVSATTIGDMSAPAIYQEGCFSSYGEIVKSDIVITYPNIRRFGENYGVCVDAGGHSIDEVRSYMEEAFK